VICGRGVALTAVLYASLAASVVAAEDGPGDPAIPPGEEEIIGAMLGRGMPVSDCRLVSGGIRYTVIRATYSCVPAGEFTVELGHPRNATRTSVRTGQFAITVQSGTPPPDFQDALAALVRSREGYFEWSWPAYDPAAENEDADDSAE